MISCLLIQVTRNQQGLPARKESVIAGELIQIGRSDACRIHLPDYRVNLLHATVRQSEDGTLYIEAEKGAAITTNGSLKQNAVLSSGTSIEIGPYLIRVEPKPVGHDIAISVEMTQPPEQDTAKLCRTAPVTLAALGFGKRKLGFGLAAFVLLAFLVLPMLPGASTAFDKWQAALPITLTESWSPGSLSGGHSVFGAKCSTCHQRAFLPVSDETCMDCHKQVANHLAEDDLHARVFKGMRCTVCHPDHRGNEGLVLHDSSICVNCHGKIKSRKANTVLADIHDFGKDHSLFHITLPDEKKAIRVRQDKKEELVEKPGLKYSHQVHLDKKGVSSPLGRTVMVCRDCHKVNEAGTHFEPMTMKETCQQSRCHKLFFTEPVEGVVPHGSEREVMNNLREYFAKWLADSPTKNMESCAQTTAAGNIAKRALECANDLAQKYAAATLFKVKGEDLECGVCHEIDATGNSDVPWKIAPLHINHDWQPRAVFQHSKHNAIDCTECHDKVNSKVSADVAMPTIEKCRKCHVGNRPAKGKIRSTCDSCHRFHQGVIKASG